VRVVGAHSFRKPGCLLEGFGLSDVSVLSLWLCHHDARQVSDLPTSHLQFVVYDQGRRPRGNESLAGKSETCRPSVWQSHNTGSFP